MTTPPTAKCTPVSGFLVGVPQVIGGCQDPNQTIVACSSPGSIAYSLTTTSSNRVMGVPLTGTSSVSNVNWIYTPTSDGWYTMSYQGKEVGVEMGPNGGLLSTAPRSNAKLEIMMEFVDGAAGQPQIATGRINARVTGKYIPTSQPDSLVPTFGQSPTDSTYAYILGSQMVQYNNSSALLPILLSPKIGNVSTLPGSVAITSWIVGDVVSGVPVVYALHKDCSENGKDPVGTRARETASNIVSTQWTYVLILVVVLVFIIGIGFFIFYQMRPVEYTQNPLAIPVALAISQRGTTVRT